MLLQKRMQISEFILEQLPRDTLRLAPGPGIREMNVFGNFLLENCYVFVVK